MHSEDRYCPPGAEEFTGNPTFQEVSREDDFRQVMRIQRAPWPVYARAGSNTAVRVTAMTLMSSSCPNFCAAPATSDADFPVRSNC
jgi:hypothetical protein